MSFVIGGLALGIFATLVAFGVLPADFGILGLLIGNVAEAAGFLSLLPILLKGSKYAKL